VHRFSKDGSLISSWGTPGKEAPGEFHLPHSSGWADGTVYVCDRENSRVQVFTAEGKFLSQWRDIKEADRYLFQQAAGGLRQRAAAVDQHPGAERQGARPVRHAGVGPRALGRFPRRQSIWPRRGKRLTKYVHKH